MKDTISAHAIHLSSLLFLKKINYLRSLLNYFIVADMFLRYCRSHVIGLIFFSAQCGSVQVMWCVKRCSFIHSFSKPLLLVKVSWIPSYFKIDSTSAYFHFVQWRDLCMLDSAVRTVEKSFCKQSCDKECLKPKITPQPPPFPTLSFPVTF